MKTGEHMRVWPVLGASLLLSALIGIGILAVQAQTDTQTNTQSTPSSARRIANPTIWPPRPVPPPRPELGRELQLISQTAQVSISGGVARTKLLQTFQNTANHTIEGVYVFPLPEGAAVSGFAMTVNGKRQEAEILDGDKAREIYTGIVQKMRDPAILEFIDRNLVRARIFPIAARAEQKIELEYSESLKAESGAYRFVVPLRLPTGGAAQKATVDVRIESNEGIRAVYSPTHDVEVKRDGDTARISGEWGSLQPRPIPATLRDETSTFNNRSGSDRDFVLYYTTARQRVGVNLVTHRGSDEDGYFMLLAAPDATVAPSEIAAKDVVFVFDTSGSMAGEKIEQARKALLNLLGNLNPNDRFNIVTFSSDVRTFREGLTPVSTQSVQAARAFTNEIKAVGGTNINDALTEAMKMFKASAVQDGRPHQLIFMTDGQPTVGETDVTEILKNVRAKNEVGGVRGRTPEAHTSWIRLFAFGVGYDVNTRLLDTLAEDNRGSSDYVLPQEDIEQKVGSLYAKIAYPVLANPRVEWGGMNVYDVYPKRLPDLFKGTQTVVFGRYKGNNAARVQLIGTSRGREERVAGSGSFGDRGQLNDTLPRLWAVRKVGYLLDDARREGRTLDKEVQDEIIKLSKRYGIVTPLTAGLITEDGDGAIATRPLSAGGFPGAPSGVRANESVADSTTRARVPALSAAPARGQLFRSQSGAGAVAASKATSAMREARQVKDEANVRYIEGKAFFLKDGVWTDGAYDAAKSPKLVTIKAFSPEYLNLLKDAKVAKWLSVGERAIIVLNDKTIKVEP